MQAGRTGWPGGEVCSGSPIAGPVPRRMVSANFENASRIRAFGFVRVFGHGTTLFELINPRDDLKRESSSWPDKLRP